MSNLTKRLCRIARSGIFLTVLLSMVFHGSILLVEINFTKNKVSKTAPKRRILVVFKNTKKRSEAVKNQIVATNDNGKEVIAPDTRFVGKRNETHKKQTVARIIGKYKRAGIGSKTALNRMSKRAKRSLIKAKKLSLNDLSHKSVTFNPRKYSIDNMAPRGIRNGSKKSYGLAQSSDFIDDLPLGDMSNINTQEFKYYGFYFRIKQRLEEFWGVSLKNKTASIARRGGRMPANVNKTTSLTVSLDNFGNIIGVRIDGSSGIKELDDAAIESFNNAGPFPNPPKGMLVQGKATIKWAFVVKV